MDTLIVPIVKDKKGSLTSKDNYRPIAITSVISKILESAILKQIKGSLLTTDNQFGFKEKSGTDMCVFTLKQVIEYYNSRSSPIYICFLDASKAFDRLNHWSLFAKLIKRKVHFHVICLIMYWYCNQTFRVAWGGLTSECFTVSNGVRQGGILSPILFNIYMDDLSVVLNNSKLGCRINGTAVNHLMYADDTCLIASSPTALQNLLNICSDFAYVNSVVFNEGKTKLMCYKPKSLANLRVPEIFVNGKSISVVNEHKYLGILLQDNQSDESDMKRQVKATYTRGNMLASRFKNCSADVKKTVCLGPTVPMHMEANCGLISENLCSKR